MIQYPKRPVDEEDKPQNDGFDTTYIGKLFQNGSAYAHVRYMIEMSRRHPVLYWIWYRWWIPSLLHEDERKRLDHWRTLCLKYEFRPYWADFALYHPVQFLMFLLLWRTLRIKLIIEFPVKLFTIAIKKIGRIGRDRCTKDSTDYMRTKDKLVIQDGNMSSNGVAIT